MWKKNEETPQPVTAAPRPAARPQAPSQASVIGASIRIKGDLTGQENLLIQGQLEGEVRLKSNNVTVGKDGRIRADIYGRSVYVEGEVKGHLFGEQEVVIRASGKVQGDIVSPRVVLENGSNFKGSIDMEPAAAAQPEAPAKPKKAASAGAGGPAPVQPAATAQPTPSAQSDNAAEKPAAAQGATSAAGNRQ
ncbi:MAG: polymer-forming cytoskeletal protein [bacterium]|nr:polymer-forming cytoskeletal protein [bacterium]